MPPERTSVSENSGYHLVTTTPDGKICKPSRKTFERQCKQLAGEINVIQSRLADNKAHLNELYSKLDKLRKERDAKFVEKSAVESTVRDMSVNINRLSERLAQLQSKLHYRDMKKLEDAIRTLQNHLDSNHFKHSEEKKIVAEIDKLNRSKKVVGEYLGTQKELKELRTNQHSRRVDRDKLIKDIVVIRKQEEETRSVLTTAKTHESQLRADIEGLIENKNALKAEFTKHQQTFAEQKAAIKQAEMESRQKQQQTCCRAVTTRCLSYSASTAEALPQTQEMVNCQKLIEFCERLTKALGDDRAAQRQRKKKISYTTDILSQFLSIDMCPPMTVAQACTCVPLLQQKLTDLKKLQTVTTYSPISEETHIKDTVLSSIPSVEVTSDHVEPTTDVIANTPTAEVSAPTVEDVPTDSDDIVAEHPDDHSDNSSMTKQLSSASDEDTIETMAYKLELLETLCHVAEQKSGDSSIA